VVGLFICAQRLKHHLAKPTCVKDGNAGHANYILYTITTITCNLLTNAKFKTGRTGLHKQYDSEYAESRDELNGENLMNRFLSTNACIIRTDYN